MKPRGGRLNVLAIFAILFLLGFGFVVYAVPGSTLAPVTNGSTSTTSGGAEPQVVYHLVKRAPPGAGAAPGETRSGYAGIAVTGQSLSLEWAVTGELPGERLRM